MTKHRIPERQKTQQLLDELEENEGKTDEKNERMHEKLKGIKRSIDAYKTEQNALSNQLESTNKEMKKQRKELQGIQRLITSLNSKKKTLEKDNKTYKGKKDEYELELADIEQQIEAAKERLSAIVDRLDRKQKKAIELRQDLKKNEAKLKHLYAKKERLGQFKNKTPRNNHLKPVMNGHKKEIEEQEKLDHPLRQKNQKQRTRRQSRKGFKSYLCV
eukprot:342483_1